MKRLSLVLAGFTFAIFLSHSSIAQKSKFQSIFIYNFSKYIKWPDDFNEGKFVIGVLGNAEIKKALESMVVAKKETNGLKMEIQSFSSIGELGDCNILFVNNKFCSQLNDIENSLGSKPTLIVTDKTGMTEQGAIINFIEQDGKIKFELHQQNANAKGLKIAGSLTSLAIIV